MTPAAKRRHRRRLKVQAMEADIRQMRRLLDDVLCDGVQDCDGIDSGGDPCACSTARARRVLAGEPEFPPLDPNPQTIHPREVERAEVRLAVDMTKFNASGFGISPAAVRRAADHIDAEARKLAPRTPFSAEEVAETLRAAARGMGATPRYMRAASTLDSTGRVVSTRVEAAADYDQPFVEVDPATLQPIHRNPDTGVSYDPRTGFGCVPYVVPPFDPDDARHTPTPCPNGITDCSRANPCVHCD